MNGLFKRLTACTAAAALACSALGMSAFADDSWDELDQAAFTKAMGLGWNLGNTFEALKDIGGGVYEPEETAWGNPVVTEDQIKAVKEAGFSSIRMPVGWLTHIGDKESGYKVEQAWFDRLHEVVDWCVKNDVYVIMNVHSDGYHSIGGAWLFCDAPDDEQVEIKAKYKSLWTQIAEEFKDEDEHLIFESMNEEFDGKSYNSANKDAYNNINDYNQIFVDAVRATGGNNTKRWLLVPGWNTDIDLTVSSMFKIPEDSGCTSDGNRIAVSVHYYSPYDFVLNEGNSKVTQWGKYAETGKNDSWGYEDYLADQMKKLSNSFTSKGYPVIIGEFSPTNKNSFDQNNAAFRRYWSELVVKEAKANGAIPVYWDNGYYGKGGCAVINRRDLSLYEPEIVEGMVRAMSTDGDYAVPPVNVVTTSEDYTLSPVAHLMLSGYDWYPQTGFDDGTVAKDINVVYGENSFTYTGFTDKEGNPSSFAGSSVFVIDLLDCADKLGDIKIEDVTVICDGKEIPVDQSKVKVGDPENKNNVRIEIYNMYGDTKDAPAVDLDQLKADSEIIVKFNAYSIHLDGYKAPESSESEAESSSVSESESTSESSSESSSESAADSSSKAESSSSKAESSSSKAASNNTTSNPGTGAVVGFAAVAVSMAGAVIARRKNS